MRLCLLATLLLARSAAADSDLSFATIPQLQQYLASPHPDADRVIVATSRLGELLLHASWLDEPRFANWFKVKTAAATALRDRLAAIVALHDPATTIAAAAFAGQLAQTMADAIAGAEIPVRLGRSDPEKYPAAGELRPTPDQVAPILDVSE